MSVCLLSTGVHRHSFHFKDTKKPFSYPALLRCAFQFADALRYLHDEAVPGMCLRMIDTLLVVVVVVMTGWQCGCDLVSMVVTHDGS